MSCSDCCPSEDTQVNESVQEYYGKILQKSKDLQTNACCTEEGLKLPKNVKAALAQVHDEIHEKYYGCGLVVPELIENCK